MPKLIASVNLKNIISNAEEFIKLTKTKLCAVVKADAYGHGAEKVVCALSEKADFFAVSCLAEAVAIQTASCGKPILVLAPPTSKREAEELVRENFRISVTDLRSARLVADACRTCKKRAIVHIKVNTGMNRYGVDEEDFQTVCAFLSSKSDRIFVEGLFSHLYTQDRKICENQRLSFEKFKGICLEFFPKTVCHLSATFGALLGKDYAYDMVRIGLGLYGYVPSGTDGLKGIVKQLKLKKAMKISAVVSQSRNYRFGGAGYGLIDEKQIRKAEQEGLSVLHAGYGDGLFRSRGIEEKRNALFNCLCMDACVVSGKKKVGDKVPVLTDAEKLAEKTGTIAYEVLCSVRKRAETEYEYE